MSQSVPEHWICGLATLDTRRSPNAQYTRRKARVRECRRLSVELSTSRTSELTAAQIRESRSVLPLNSRQRGLKMKNRVYRMGELFSGPGGLALGARLAARSVGGVQILHTWANDLDLDTCATYRRNILEPEFGKEARIVEHAEDLPANGGGIVHQNVHDLNISALGNIDGFAFGFPCNDYSLVGEWKGLDGEYGPLYSYGVEVLARKQPKWFVAENVSGLRGANEGKAFKKILEHLKSPREGLSYRLTPHLYSFDEYGVPQRRQRIVIVGIRDDLGISFHVPSPRRYSEQDVTAAGALNKPPIAKNAPNHEFAQQAPHVVERLSYLLPGENAFSPRALKEMPERLHINTRTTISTTYKRLEPDKPSYTVTGSGGGGSYIYHWDENRALTNRERARLQSFPDDFVFEGLKDSVRRQIGMAVPVKGAEAIFSALFKSLAGVKYESVPPNIDVSRVLETYPHRAA